jgi:pilus assembly protein FimV
LEIDFPLDEPADGAEPLPQPTPDDLDLQFDTSEPEPEPEPEPEDESDARPAAPPEPLPLDLGSLSLDLGEEFQNSKAALSDLSDDPLETKLDLAEEFRAIGDEDGARALIEEVIEAASGDMKARAERALSKLK